MVYAGTSVMAGEALAVAVAVGAASVAGDAETGERHVAGGVEGRLRQLTSRAIPISIGAGAAVVGAGLLRGLLLADGLASGVSLAVAAVPEGLPLVATMAQLSSAQRLAGKGALVRNHRAIEALGRVDVLCTDKTGTLTIGRLSVRVVSDLLSSDVESEAAIDDLGDSHRRVLAAALRATPEPEEGYWLAHLTDARHRAGRGHEAGPVDDAARRPVKSCSNRARLPRHGAHRTPCRVISVKGAPEVVARLCRPVGAPRRAAS